MTSLRIYNLEDINDSHPVCTLLEGEHLVGRGPTMNITDKRVSRNHAQFIVRDHGVCIKSVHINPCFFKASVERKIQILKKDEMIEMKDGDTFAFLADQCWYRVKLIFDEEAAVSNISANVLNSSKRSYPGSSSEPSKRKKMDEDKTLRNICYVSKSQKCTSPNNPHIPIKTKTSDDVPLSLEESVKESIADMLPPTANVTTNDITALPLSSMNYSIYHGRTDNMIKNLEEVSPQPSPSKLYASVESLKNTVNEELSASDESLDLFSEHRWDMDQTADIQDVEEEARVQKETKAKPEEDKKEEQEALDRSSTGVGSNHNAGTSCTNANPSTTRRERCWYSGSCYRKNLQHRSDFSHPGDTDYESDPNNERPYCPFGASCYRTNKDHRMQYKHLGKPASKPIHIAKNGASVNDSGEDSTDCNAAGTIRKERKAALKKAKYTDTPEDDYDFDDPFINDDSSDDFELSDNDDEDSTDYEFQNVDEENTEDKKLMLRDAKKFLKKNRLKKNRK